MFTINIFNVILNIKSDIFIILSPKILPNPYTVHPFILLPFKCGTTLPAIIDLLFSHACIYLPTVPSNHHWVNLAMNTEILSTICTTNLSTTFPTHLSSNTPTHLFFNALILQVHTSNFIINLFSLHISINLLTNTIFLIIQLPHWVNTNILSTIELPPSGYLPFKFTKLPYILFIKPTYKPLFNPSTLINLPTNQPGCLPLNFPLPLNLIVH